MKECTFQPKTSGPPPPEILARSRRQQAGYKPWALADTLRVPNNLPLSDDAASGHGADEDDGEIPAPPAANSSGDAFGDVGDDSSEPGSQGSGKNVIPVSNDAPQQLLFAYSLSFLSFS